MKNLITKTKGFNNTIHHASINIVEGNSYKIGMDEVMGLENMLNQVVKPLQDILLKKVYWMNEVNFNKREYKSRDGFSAYSHNCGGIEFREVIPECEASSFNFLEFGEVDSDDIDGYSSMSDEEKEIARDKEVDDSIGYFDSALLIGISFEGFNKKGQLQFYIYLSGGNGDAPYFRTKSLTDIFDASISAYTMVDAQKKLTLQINKILKIIK